MTIAQLSLRGDTIPSGSWIRPSVSGTAQISFSWSCHSQLDTGHGCAVTALTAGDGTISFVLGNYSGCLDPPECTGREWHADTTIEVPVLVR